MTKAKTKSSLQAQCVKKLSSKERHARDCKLCNHPQREEIEREWTRWAETTVLAKQYGLTRDSIYRHAHALGLFEKRARNIRAALEQIIEKATGVEVTAAAVVSAVQAYAKINAQGQWVERFERVDMREIFERMTREELEAYAQTGKLPGWAPQLLTATRFESNEEVSDG